MSTFEVKLRHIDRVETHPNADKLELVVIGGYRAVVQRGIHKSGDLVLYIPENAVFTEIGVAEKLNIASYLTGKDKNRVKSIRLRGILSQGVVIPARVIEEYIRTTEFKFDFVASEGVDLRESLLIEKYEEPIPIEMAGQVRKWPSFLTKYDVENIKRPESMAAMIPGELVVMTEKLHGTNMTVALGPGLDDDEDAFVCSRNMALKESATNVYWRAVRKYGLIEKLHAIADRFNIINITDPKLDTISIHGEVVGVQDLKYGFTNRDIGFYAFDIRVNGEYVQYDVFTYLCDAFNVPRVPELYYGPYDYDTLNKIAHGKTELGADHIREGGVIRPVRERITDAGDRAQFKFVSEDYLTRSNPNPTEYH